MTFLHRVSWLTQQLIHFFGNQTGDIGVLGTGTHESFNFLQNLSVEAFLSRKLHKGWMRRVRADVPMCRLGPVPGPSLGDGNRFRLGSPLRNKAWHVLRSGKVVAVGQSRDPKAHHESRNWLALETAVPKTGVGLALSS